MKAALLVVVFLAAGTFVPRTLATVIELTATDAGFVTEAGGSAKGDGTVVSAATYNYSVGRELHYDDGALFSPLAETDRKNYFVFDLSGITDPIVSATFMVYAGTYESVDPTETFEIKETTDPGSVLFDIDALAAGNLIGPSEFDEPTDPLVGTAAGLHIELADGPLLLGATIISSGDDDTTLSIPITPGGIGYLNLFLGSRLVLGGTVSTAPPGTFPQQPFGFTGPDIPGGDILTPTLEIVTLSSVPEPSTVAYAVLGALLLGGRWLRRRSGTCGA